MDPDTTEKKSDDAGGEDETEAKINAIVNRAITGHMKRFSTSFEKSIGEKLAALAGSQGAKPKTEGGAEQQPGENNADPKYRALQDELARLKTQADEDRNERQRVEKKAKRQEARQSLRNELERGGVRPEMLDIAVGHLAKATKSLKIDPETGKPVLKVARVRVKNGSVEEQLFDDLSAGVRDFLKSDQAKVFLPAPNAKNAHGQGTSMTSGKGGQRYDKPAASDEEAVNRTLNQLETKGFDLSSLLSE